jgi:hypothetical protein
MTEAVNSTTSGIYRKGWAALAVKAAGKASGLGESRIAMHETQTRVVDELTNSDGPTFAKLMTMAERELGAFISAVTELFGSGQVTGRLSAVARASCKTQEPEILSSRLEVSRYLVYLNNRAAGKSSVKTIDLSDQKTAPLTPKSLIYNRRSYSQAGCRGFESRLPLQFLLCPARRHG